MRFSRFSNLLVATILAATPALPQAVASAPSSATQVVAPADTQRPAARPTDYVQLLAAAQNSYRHGRYDEARAQFEAVRVRARAEQQDLWEARAISGLAGVAYHKGEYSEARSRLLQSLTAFERLREPLDQARAQNMLGMVAFYMGDAAEAKMRYSQAAALYAAAGNVRGQIAATRNLISVAKFSAKEEDDLFRQLEREAQNAGAPTFLGSVLHLWGDRYFDREDFEHAIEKLEQAAEVLKNTDDRGELATVYNSLGRLYRFHGQPAAALRYQLQALEIHQSLNSAPTIVQSLEAVAVAYDTLGDERQARTYYERATAVADKTDSPLLQDFARADLAKFLVNNGDFARAAHILEEVLRRGVDAHSSNRHAVLASAYLGLGRFSDALAEAQKSLEVCGRDAADCIYARLRLVESELALGHENRAMEEDETALQEIEALHARLAASDFLKQGFHHTFQSTYSFTIELHFRRGEYRQALEVSEQARSRAFLDLLASRNLEPKTDPHKDARSSLASNHDGTTNHVVLTLRGGAGSTAPLSFRAGLPSIATATPLHAKDLCAIAKRLNSTLLQYWVSAGALYIWVVHQDGTISGSRVNISASELEKMVAATIPFHSGGEPLSAAPSQQMATRGGGSITVSDTDLRVWRRLYNVLIKPVRKELPAKSGARLTIVPHGPLLGLSFAALLSPSGRYLLEDYTLHYVPAGTILKYTWQERHPDARHGQILLVADPAVPPPLPGEPPLLRLPGARKEALAIARLAPKSHVTLLMGDAATETRVRLESSNKSVLHFATHAIVLDGNPLNSYLMLARPGDGSANGYLTAQEIYNLKLHSDLVVLSACRSGGGRVTGDGLAALARAFFYAGTPSIIASLWDVPDQPTNQLLPQVYRAWLNGSDKDVALRAAQLRLLRDLRRGKITLPTPEGELRLPEHPMFWASFILLGEPQ